MRPATRQALVRRLLTAIEQPSAEPLNVTLSPDRYVCEAWAARERDAVFRVSPLVIAHSSELPEPGAFVSETVAGRGVVVVRGKDGSVSAFVNACRHRGARLVEGSGCTKAFVCPYHAWCYDLDGSVMHIPHREVFAATDLEKRGLIALPCAERHGFVWVTPTPGPALDVAAWLGPALDDDYTSFRLDGYRQAQKTDRLVAANWKLIVDAFAEGYHLRSLHKKSISRFFREESILDDFAPHIRQLGARKTLGPQSPAEPSEADLRDLTTVLYNQFPNVAMVFHPEWLSHMTLWPVTPGTSRVLHRMLVPVAPASDEVERRRAQSFGLIDGQVFEKEDLAITQSIQSTMADRDDPVVLGGMERGVALFHRALESAMDAT